MESMAFAKNWKYMLPQGNINLEPTCDDDGVDDDENEDENEGEH